MAIWTRTPTKEDLLKSCQNTAVSHMGIEFLEVGDNFLKGRMPVDKRTVQPFGVLHGGSSVLLAETLGSMAANYCLRDQGTVAVGLEINANHLRPVTNGWVYGTATALHLGSATQVWDIVIENEQGKKTCVSRLTMAVTKAR
ncbi:MAG: 1,4-dihydroxy-2-naphthoyl-CoA hydrolase [Marinobacter psychrophilus]